MPMRRFIICPWIVAFALSACSGGGGSSGGVSTLSPVPVTPPPPDYDTAEYRANYGLGAINAIAAYDEGLSGEGVTVAVVDTGVDLDHPDLDGNISPQSIGLATNSYAGANDLDENGHGTAVAGIVAAEKNDYGMHGVAFDATLLAINATHSSDCPGECTYYQSDIADGIRYAETHGAKVINLSMGGAAVGAYLESAMQDAVEAGIIIVISAGNDSAALPSDFARIAAAPWAQGRIIIAGAVDSANALADFSNQAGDGFKDVYVVAPGVDVRSTGAGGSQVIASGTSFSAPHVTGAIALLAEMFPNLSAAELTEIIFTTAQDLGDPGVDATFGSGLIDLAAAIAPVGATGIPTSGGAVPAAADTPATTATALSLSAPFGDALTGHTPLSRAMMLDAYGRSYRLDLTRMTSWAGDAGTLFSLVSGRQHGFARRETIAPGLTLNYAAARDADMNRIIDAGLAEIRRPSAEISISRDLGDGRRFAFAINDPESAVDDARPTPFLSQPEFALGLVAEHSFTAHVEEPVGGIRLSFTSSLALTPDMAGPLNAGRTRLMRAAALIDVGKAATLTLGLGLLDEDGSVLGSRSAGALSLGSGARTRLFDARFTWSPQTGPAFYIHGVLGRTTVQDGGPSLLRTDGAIVTSAAEAGALWDNALTAGDTLGVRIALPPRVESGRLLVGEVTGRDYAADALTFRETPLSLAPTGREVDMEAAYVLTLENGAAMRVNARYALSPGHRADAADAASVLLSLSQGF